MNERAVRQLLQRHHALLEGHFHLSSGLHSDRYLQCAQVLQYPDEAERLGRALAARIAARRGAAPDVVVAPALGGMIIGHEVARALGCRSVFTERREGRMGLRRGFGFAVGERAVLVEDVVTTGRSSRETLAVMREAGALPILAACIANRSRSARLDGIELVALVPLEVTSWEPSQCPLCARGVELTRPGSRPCREM